MAGRNAGRTGGRGKPAGGRGGRGRGGRWKPRDHLSASEIPAQGSGEGTSHDDADPPAQHTQGGQISRKGQKKAKPRKTKPQFAVSIEAVDRHTQTPSAAFVPESKLAEIKNTVFKAQNYLREMNEKYLQACNALDDVLSGIDSIECDNLNGVTTENDNLEQTQTRTTAMNHDVDKESGRDQSVEVSEPGTLNAVEGFQRKSPSAESMNVGQELQIKSPLDARLSDELTPENIDWDLKWHYRNLHDNVFSPYERQQMIEWYRGGHLKTDLPVGQFKVGPFCALSRLFPDERVAFLTPDEADEWIRSNAKPSKTETTPSLFYTDAQGVEHGPFTDEEYRQHVMEDARKTKLARLENERIEAARVEEEGRRLREEEEQKRNAEIEQQRAEDAERKRRANERRKQLAEEEKAEAKMARELMRKQKDLKRKQAAEELVEAKRKEAEERQAQIDAIKSQNVPQQQPTSGSSRTVAIDMGSAGTLEEASTPSGYPQKGEEEVLSASPAEKSSIALKPGTKPTKRAVTVSIGSGMDSSAKSVAVLKFTPNPAKPNKRVRPRHVVRQSTFDRTKISAFVYPYDRARPSDEHDVFALIVNEETRPKGRNVILLNSNLSVLQGELRSLEYQRGGGRAKAEKELLKEQGILAELSEKRTRIADVYRKRKKEK